MRKTAKFLVKQFKIISLMIGLQISYRKAKEIITFFDPFI